MNFAKFLESPVLQNTSGRLLLYFEILWRFRLRKILCYLISNMHFIATFQDFYSVKMLKAVTFIYQHAQKMKFLFGISLINVKNSAGNFWFVHNYKEILNVKLYVFCEVSVWLLTRLIFDTTSNLFVLNIALKVPLSCYLHDLNLKWVIKNLLRDMYPDDSMTSLGNIDEKPKTILTEENCSLWKLITNDANFQHVFNNAEMTIMPTN